MADDDNDPTATNGGSIADRTDTEPEEELFPLGSIDGDPGVTLKTLIRAGHSVSSTVSMMTAEVPAPKGSLLSPENEHLILMTAEVAHYVPVPQREGERATGKKITGYKIRQVLRPIFVERVEGEAGAIQANFEALMTADAGMAGALLDILAAKYREKLTDGKHPARVPQTA